MGQVGPAEILFTTAAPLPERPQFGVNWDAANDDQNNVTGSASGNDYATTTFPYASITDAAVSDRDPVVGKSRQR